MKERLACLEAEVEKKNRMLAQVKVSLREAVDREERLKATCSSTLHPYDTKVCVCLCVC